jgi:putative tricarboxylic transport membrane protein
MRVSDSLIGFVMILFGLAVIVYTRGFPAQADGHPGPEFFPNVLAGLFMLAGLGLAIGGFRRGEKIFHFEAPGLGAGAVVNILLVLGVAAAYILISDFLGFIITSFVLMGFLMKWLAVTWRWTLIMSAALTMVIYLLFAKVLLVPLPWGLWGW